MIVIGVEIAPEIAPEIEIRVVIVAAITIINIRGPIVTEIVIVTEIEIVTEIATMTAIVIVIVIIMELKIILLRVLRPTLIQRCRKGLVHFQRPRRTPSVIRV